MNSSFRVILGAILSLIAVSVPAFTNGPEKSTRADATAKIELQIGPGKVKVVSVTLGQNAMEVFRLCKPAKAYADDDPWLGYMASGGGVYVLFFSAEGKAREMRGRLDPRRDKLYAVVQYPTESRENGKILLPKTMHGKTYGDFVTLKVPLGSGKTKVATVALGMSIQDVKHLFQAAPDRADGDQNILYNSSDGGGYLLIFSPHDGGNSHDSRHDKLSEVMYRPGGKTKAIYLLPRNKRGKFLPAKSRTLLENSSSDAEPNRPEPAP